MPIKSKGNYDLNKYFLTSISNIYFLIDNYYFIYRSKIKFVLCSEERVKSVNNTLFQNFCDKGI